MGKPVDKRIFVAWKRWAFASVLLLVAALSISPAIDRQASVHYESLFQRALVTFALARTLNGVISAVQGTELALQPAGVGLTLTPGEVLDPVNDLIERFSWVMLGATVSLGIQDVLMDVSGWWVIRIIAAGLAMLMMVMTVRARGAHPSSSPLLARLLLVALFLRFAVPATLIANDALFTVFLESRYLESTEVIITAGERLEEIGAPEPEISDATDDSLSSRVFGSIGQAIDSAANALDLRQRIERIRLQTASVIEHVIQLSVVFILQTGILPVVFLWLFVQLGKWVFRPIRLQHTDK